jgi:H+/Cl- antiporter ClcA
VFGTPVSGAIFGIEVLYLGQIEYGVIFPALIAGIVGHLACGTSPPFPDIPPFLDHGTSQIHMILITLASGALLGIVALLLIETMRVTERVVRRISAHPYWVAAGGGAVLVAIYLTAGEEYAGLGTLTIDGLLSGLMTVMAYAFLVKILATSVTLESGGSGGVLTPIFFVGAASGAAMAPVMSVPPQLLSSFGLVAVLGAVANTRSLQR